MERHTLYIHTTETHIKNVVTTDKIIFSNEKGIKFKKTFQHIIPRNSKI